MLPDLRQRFNRDFTADGYRAFVRAMEARAGVPIEYRLSETPCFFGRTLIDRLAAEAGAMIDALLTNDAYRRAADAEVPPPFLVANGETLPTFVQVDFGLVRTNTGVEGRLVELQAFPSLYGFQFALAQLWREQDELSSLSGLIGDLEPDAYIALMRRVLVGDHDPSEVVLMEIDPEHQKTRPDFEITRKIWGIEAIDVRGVVRDGRRLLRRRNGTLVPIARVYNRVIPDELVRKGLTLPFDYRDGVDVEWTGGPDWYFRISKFSIPWLAHPWVPRTRFLSDVTDLPADRDNCLLKPLYSFAGGGIVFAPTDEQITAIPSDERRRFILQERVSFTPVIDTPHGPTQAELRIMFVRDDGTYRPLVPLVRMGRGKMMGVDHNKNLEWVGSSAALIDRSR